MSERTEAIYNSIRNNYGRLANGARPWESNRDEMNDVLNYAPTEGQQTYSVGTDDAGNEILGNTINDFMAQPQPKEEEIDTEELIRMLQQKKDEYTNRTQERL